MQKYLAGGARYQRCQGGLPRRLQQGTNLQSTVHGDGKGGDLGSTKFKPLPNKSDTAASDFVDVDFSDEILKGEETTERCLTLGGIVEDGVKS